MSLPVQSTGSIIDLTHIHLKIWSYLWDSHSGEAWFYYFIHDMKNKTFIHLDLNHLQALDAAVVKLLLHRLGVLKRQNDLCFHPWETEYSWCSCEEE